MKRSIIFFSFLLCSKFVFCQSDSLRVTRMFDRAYIQEIADPDYAITIYDSIISLAQFNKHPLFVSKALNYKGIVYNNTGRYDSALVYYKKSLNSFKNINHTRGVASNYINIGNTFKLQDNYTRAIEHYILGIALYEVLKDTLRLAISYANLATIYDDIGDVASSKNHYKRSNRYAENVADSIQLTYNSFNLFELYAKNYQADSAVIHIKKARQYLPSQKELELHFLVHYGEARALFEMENNSKAALQKAKIAAQEAEVLANPYYTGNINHLLGRIYLANGNIKKATAHTQICVSTGKIHGNKSILMKAYEQLSEIHQEKKDYQTALKYKNLMHQLYAEYMNEKQIKQTKLLDIQYKTAKKNKEIAAQKAILQKQETKLRAQQNRQYILIGVALFFLAVLIFLWWTYKQRKRQKNQEILALKREHQIHALEFLIEGEEKERMRIAKELHDGVNGDLSAIKFKLSTTMDAQNKLMNEISRMIDKSCSQIRAISHNLIPPSLENLDLSTTIKNYCISMTSVQDVLIQYQCIGTPYNLNKKVEVHIFRIVQELVSNALKYAEASEIHIQLSFVVPNTLQLTLEDNGKGFKMNGETKGIGLQNIDSRAQIIQATSDLKSNEQGTSYMLELKTSTHRI